MAHGWCRRHAAYGLVRFSVTWNPLGVTFWRPPLGGEEEISLATKKAHYYFQPAVLMRKFAKRRRIYNVAR